MGNGHDPWDALTRARDAERAAEAKKEKESWFSGIVAKIMISLVTGVICVVLAGVAIGYSEHTATGRMARSATGTYDAKDRHRSMADRMGPEKRKWLFLTVGLLGFASTMFWLSRSPEEDLKHLDD